MELDIGNRAISISPELWAKAYNLHAFKLVPGTLSLGASTSNRGGVTDIDFEFGTATTTPLEVLIYSESSACLEITNENRAFLV